MTWIPEDGIRIGLIAFGIVMMLGIVQALRQIVQELAWIRELLHERLPESKRELGSRLRREIG